jgi:hypothetical protein
MLADDFWEPFKHVRDISEGQISLSLLYLNVKALLCELNLIDQRACSRLLRTSNNTKLRLSLMLELCGHDVFLS